jgi:hypothetical protein
MRVDRRVDYGARSNKYEPNRSRHRRLRMTVAAEKE